MVRCFFLLIYFLVVKAIELTKMRQNSNLIHLFLDSLWVAIWSKYQNCWKIFLFFISYFLIWSVKIWNLKLSIEVQTLKAVMQNKFKKNYFKDLKFLTQHLWNFTKMYYEIKIFLFYSLQWVSVLWIRKCCTHT